jgi:hypothetical protein
MKTIIYSKIIHFEFFHQYLYKRSLIQLAENFFLIRRTTIWKWLTYLEVKEKLKKVGNSSLWTDDWILVHNNFNSPIQWPIFYKKESLRVSNYFFWKIAEISWKILNLIDTQTEHIFEKCLKNADTDILSIIMKPICYDGKKDQIRW